MWLAKLTHVQARVNSDVTIHTSCRSESSNLSLVVLDNQTEWGKRLYTFRAPACFSDFRDVFLKHCTSRSHCNPIRINQGLENSFLLPCFCSAPLDSRYPVAKLAWQHSLLTCHLYTKMRTLPFIILDHSNPDMTSTVGQKGDVAQW